jgi:two-component system sensor histidine kinase AlgZ
MSTKRTDDFFLPDFCGLQVVFGLVILSELFALVLALAGPPVDFWGRLALISLFMQWAGLSAAAVWCSGRRWLGRLGTVGGSAVAYLLLLLVVALLSEAALRIMEATGAGSGPADAGLFLWRNLAIGAIVGAIVLRYFYVQHQWKRQVRSESEARLQALEARIRPHFLFNSLNTAASLVHDHPAEAEAAMEDLADLFRASLGDSRRQVTFGAERELTTRYLHLERLRLGDRLAVEWRVDDVGDDLPMPPLLLQPLVENAVYHGVAQCPQGGTVTISGRREAGRVVLEVENPCPPTAADSHGNRMALDNIRGRLAALYGPAARLETVDGGGRFVARLLLPEQGPQGEVRPDGRATER